MTFARARQIADAVLYEGYVLYPYRASSQKNQVRWQFGIAAPRQWCDAGGCEHAWMQTECLLELADTARVLGKIRFLHPQQRRIEEAVGGAFRAVESLDVGGTLWTTWDEAVEREVDFEQDVAADTAAPERCISFEFPGGRETEDIRNADGARVGRCVRERLPLTGAVRIGLHRATGENPADRSQLVRLSVRIENTTPWADAAAPRDEAMRASFVGLHTLLAVSRGAFISLIDPPDWANAAAAQCANVRTWPVLTGDTGARDVVLSSPIILYDHPQIAPESPGDLYDATEIDEILTLRTMTLTEAEQREARATDPRAAAIIDRANNMPQEMLDKLHGAIRYLRGAPAPHPDLPPGGGKEPLLETMAPWWDPAADESVSPDSDCVEVNGVAIAKGSRVRLRPGARRAALRPRRSLRPPDVRCTKRGPAA
jgi:hypothetical protein